MMMKQEQDDLFDDFTVQCMILETIWGLGKDEKEFGWYKSPKIFNLDEEVSNHCFEFLKGKRKAVPIYDLYLSFYGVGKPARTRNRIG